MAEFKVEGEGGTLCLRWAGLQSHLAKGVDTGSHAGVGPIA